ncbi:DUF1465 family protein [Ahrensia sp. R2A130]|uniref:DUF1465 family protein n=1 Tax=Ahrensia sp. R2A130 TaxID=744979 RepID=UPI0001E0ACA4|nr:DUF1465 family protein [Ahrensia sp. R2A130]EFL88659.1 AraC family transcriptional regulator [Ahrensia sp. R2A130]
MEKPTNTEQESSSVITLALPERDFDRLFERGMALVEETSLYLDGEGRETARDLPRELAGQYGSQAMALTTRLMRMASWLLIHRSWTEDEIDDTQAMREKATLRLDKLPAPRNSPSFNTLPLGLRELIDRSIGIQQSLMAFSNAGNPAPPIIRENAVAAQQSFLRSAFWNDGR